MISRSELSGKPGQAQTLIEQLLERLPEVGTQVANEVAEGRLVPAANLARSDFDAIVSRVRDVAGDRVSKSDLSSAPYSDDERLAILVDALMRLSTTMRATRASILNLLGPQQRPFVVFADPTTDEEVEVDLASEGARLSSITAEVEEILTPILSELRDGR